MLKKATALFLALLMSLSLGVCGFAEGADEKDFGGYTITNPYESVMNLFGDENNHYRTNLHTHSTISDASVDYADMIKGYYDADFDILGFADHGVIGKNWNEKPTFGIAFAYQYLIGNKVTKLTDEEFESILGGTYPSGTRTKARGMQCVPGGIELNEITMTKSHVNGYFSPFGNNDPGRENGFAYAVSNVDKNGGISVINHPGDWLESRHNEDAARDINNVRLFGDILNEYKSCLGIEVFNGVDSLTHNDRILWDQLLAYVIPHGERNVFGFGNSDAHELDEIETSFMDFIMPEYSLDNVRKTMENGCFFAMARRPRNELGSAFKYEGMYPTVTSLTVDDETDTITVTAKDTEKIQWIANEKIIVESTEINEKGEVVSTIKLDEHTDDITCYVRFQCLGKGGACLSQAFICDDGDMARFIIEDTRTESQKKWDKFVFWLKSTLIYVVCQELYRIIAREFS